MLRVEVMPVGSSVLVGDDIPATITGVWIREKCHISYQCVWWNGRERKECWLERHEVQGLEETQGTTVGFAVDGNGR